MYMIWFIGSAFLGRLTKCQPYRRNVNVMPVRCHNMDQSRALSGMLPIGL